MFVNKYQKEKFCIIFVLSFLFFPFITKAVTCDPNLNGKTEAELLAIEAQCNKEISDLDQKINGAGGTKESATNLTKGINDLKNKIAKLQLEIKAKNAKIKQLGENINAKTQYIGQLSDRMTEIKKTIAKMLKDTYVMDDNTVVDMLLSSESFSNFFIDTDNYATINQQLQDLIVELGGIKKTSEDEKKTLEQRKEEEARIKFEQEKVQKTTESYKSEQQTLLSITKNKEAEYQKLIAEKEKLKNQIRNKLYKTAGGEEISFGDALKIIQPYESTVGVDSALILAVLFQESAVDSTIGKNIGKCTYNQASPCGVSGKTVMSDTQKPTYLKIMNDLGLNAETSPVSCPICRDGNYGGAMGPAQFMPVTWDGIAQRVANIIGVSYPSPFENRAAFVAAGVLLKDNQTRCKTAFTKKNDIWSCSASKYYGGLSLSGSRLTSFMKYGYGASVLKRALQFEKDIETLSL